MTIMESLLCPICKETATRCSESSCIKVGSHISDYDITVYSHCGTASINSHYNILENYPTIWWFNRIKIKPSHYGNGFGRDLMIHLCKILDEREITILNALNPYGNRDMKSLISFFEASDFKREPKLEGSGDVTMIRKPKRGEHGR